MKKTVICTITMQEKPAPIDHMGEDLSIPGSTRPVVYPVSDYLSQNLNPEDEVTVIMLCKKDPDQNYLRNSRLLQLELDSMCELKCKKILYHAVEIPFNEDANSHAKMILETVKYLPNSTEVLADITYGSKDIPIVLFSVLAFAMKFLHCEVSRILYRRVHFVNGVPQDPVLCDVASLLNLTSVIYALNCQTPDSARTMLENLLAF